MSKQAKVSQYEDFIEDTLKNDLKEIESKLEAHNKQIKDWSDLKHSIKLLKHHKEHVDDDLMVYNRILQVGNREVHAKAEVEKVNRVFVKIGCDCLLEMDYEEADKYANIRIKAIEKQIAHLRKLAVQVKVNIKLTLLAINELNKT